MLAAFDVAGAMATIRINPLGVRQGSTSDVTLNALTHDTLVGDADARHELPDAGPETTEAEPELSLKSKLRTTFVTEKLSAPDGAMYIPETGGYEENSQKDPTHATNASRIPLVYRR